jgi:hypothetical protein
MNRSESYLTAANNGGSSTKPNIISNSDRCYDQSNSKITRITSTILHTNRLNNKTKNRVKMNKSDLNTTKTTMINNKQIVSIKEAENDVENLYCNQFLADNSSILDSPIHLLWKFKKKPSSSSISKVIKVNKNYASIFFFKSLVSIFLSIIILLSTIFSFEVINILCFNNENQKTELITFKMSFFLTNIFSIMLLLSTNSRFTLLKSILSKPRTPLLFFLICFLYILILSNLFISKNYNAESKTVLKLKVALEILAGFVYSLFNITIINFLCFFSQNFQQTLSKDRFFILKNYQNTFLSFFVLFQTNTIYSSIVLLSSLYLLDEEIVKEKFCNMCNNFIRNSSNPFCPSFKGENYQIHDKNEISSCYFSLKLNFDNTHSHNISSRVKKNEFFLVNFVNFYFVVFGSILFNFLVSSLLVFLFISLKNKKKTDETSCARKTEDLKTYNIVRISFMIIITLTQLFI